MLEGKVYKDAIDEIETLYEQRKEEYQKTKDVKNRLEITKDINMTEFQKMYDQLDESLVKTYGLKLDKSIEELDISEIENISVKLDKSFNDITSKLKSYLRTGKVEDLGDLIIKEETPLEKTIKQQDEIVEIINNNRETTDDASLDVFKS